MLDILERTTVGTLQLRIQILRTQMMMMTSVMMIKDVMMKILRYHMNCLIMKIMNLGGSWFVIMMATR